MLEDPEIVKIHTLIKWLEDGGAIYPKLKMKYYEKNYRGVHAARKIKVMTGQLYSY